MTQDASPRVSVGLPVRNGERHLEEALEALLAQDLADFELIVSDNASTDSTPAILASFAARDPRIRVVRHETDIGGSGNFNSLVWLAQAPLFKWASDDDLCAPTFLSTCVKALDTDPGLVLAYPKTVLIDERGEVIRNHEDRLHLDSDDPVTRIRDFVRHRWLCNPLFGVIRTDVLRRTSLERPYPSSDIALLGELAVAGRFHEVPERLFYRRLSASSVGVGALDRWGVAQWYRPGSRPGLVPPSARVLVDLNRAIAAADLTLGQRLRTAAVFSFEWTKNRTGVTLWKIRIARSGAPRPTVGDPVSH